MLALPTGRTPLELYRELVARHARGGLDLSCATTFNLDEFVGVAGDDAGSFRAYLDRHLCSKVRLAQSHFLDGAAPDLDAECERYERALADAGGLDVALLGIGTNGHVAFNEPGAELSVGTTKVRLSRETRLANAAFFGDEPSRVPLEALTMGMGTILAARELVVMAFGASKREAVKRMLSGKVTTEHPASLLQLHPKVTLYLDAAAAP